jgi:hypothetical protein
MLFVPSSPGDALMSQSISVLLLCVIGTAAVGCKSADTPRPESRTQSAESTGVEKKNVAQEEITRPGFDGPNSEYQASKTVAKTLEGIPGVDFGTPLPDAKKQILSKPGVVFTQEQYEDGKNVLLFSGGKFLGLNPTGYGLTFLDNKFIGAAIQYDTLDAFIKLKTVLIEQYGDPQKNDSSPIKVVAWYFPKDNPQGDFIALMMRPDQLTILVYSDQPPRR